MRDMTIREAVGIIIDNVDMEAIQEITENYPFFSLAVARGDLAAMVAPFSDEFTLSKLNDCKVKGCKQEKAKAAGDGKDDVAMDDMTVKELMNLCDEKGIKIPHYGKNKQFYIDKLKKADGKVEPETQDTDDDESWDDEQQADPYEGKTAKELHKMCKERGIQADIRKPAKFYADLLRKADEEETDGDGWDDEEPAKKTKKSGKASKKAEPDDDEDEWDI